MALRQETDIPTGDRTRVTVTAGEARFSLRIRVPGWLASGDTRAELRVNGRRTGGRLEPGTRTTVTRHWRTGDHVELVLPRVPVWRPAPDNPQVRALSYGPLVLAGGYGDTPLATPPTVRPGTLRRTPGEPTRFTVLADGRQVPLRPFHEIHHQRYNVYWSVEPRRTPPGDVARYPLDEGHGTSVTDRTGTFADGSLAGGATWSTDGDATAVVLDGRDGHVVLPAGLPSGLTELTVSARVRVDTLAPSARVFDLGYSKDTYLFLTATTGAGRARAALKIAGMEAEDFVDATGPLPLGRWTHVALTLAGGTGVLYVDGAEAGRNTAMVAGPLLLGRTSRNYLGRSQNSTHPFLHGAVRDFRLHNRALTADQVRHLAQG
ncbi:LamG-like jellyroll fold domain-containing protein OS=Streptomyces tendae OX=1932 GN=GUR47_06640 PE=4 SV=1 [Streptomyces tendae]